MQSTTANKLPPKAARKAPPLRADALYLTPTGRRCQWVPHQGHQSGMGPTHLTFRYVAGTTGGGVPWGDAFSLSRDNLWMLRVLHNGRGAQ